MLQAFENKGELERENLLKAVQRTCSLLWKYVLIFYNIFIGKILLL